MDHALQFQFTPFPVLETERLILRCPTLSDLDAFYYLRSSPVEMTYIDRDPDPSKDVSLEKLKEVIEAIQNNKAIMWAITRKPDDVYIGSIGYWRIQAENHRAEIGYVLHHDYWKQGLMQEAMQAVLNYGFSQMHLHSIVADINPANLSSIRLVERLGFQREAYFRDNWYYNGKYLDSAIYCLLESDWKNSGFLQE